MKPLTHGFDGACFAKDSTLKLALQAMVMGGRCVAGGELMDKTALDERARRNATSGRNHDKPSTPKPKPPTLKVKVISGNSIHLPRSNFGTLFSLWTLSLYPLSDEH